MTPKRLALLLSVLVIGAGQIYLDQAQKGLTLILAAYFGIPFVLLFFLNFLSFFFPLALGFALLTLFSLWLYALIDVWKTKN